MPKTNRSRTIGAQARLAARIRYERKRRDGGWSPTKLAQKMAAIGCPIAPQAIYKIEDPADPAKPRQVTVDELAALALVFDMSVDDLLRDMSEVLQGRADELVKALAANTEAIAALAAGRLELIAELGELRADNDRDSDVMEYLRHLLDSAPTPADSLVTVRVRSDEGDGAIDVPTGPIAGAVIQKLDTECMRFVDEVAQQWRNRIRVSDHWMSLTRDGSPLIFEKLGEVDG